MSAWDDDERNVHVFLTPDPPVEQFIPNIYKYVNDHLKNLDLESVVNSIEYVVYEYEPLTVVTEDETDSDDIDYVHENDETNQYLLDQHVYAYI